MSPYRKIFIAVLGLTLTAGGVAACSKEAGPQPVVDAFLKGWTSGNLNDVALLKPSGEKLASADVAEELKALSGAFKLTPPTLKSTKLDVKEDIATAEIAVSQPLPGGPAWDYATSFRLSKGKDGWRVIWEARVVHPNLTPGDSLDVRRSNAVRAGVITSAGDEIVKPRPVVVIGVEPARVTNVDQLVKDLNKAFAGRNPAIDLTSLPAQLAAAKPNAFVEVVTLRKEEYTPLRDKVRNLPGTVFREENLMLAPSRTFARQLLGTVGPVTKEIVDANPNVYTAGMQAGLGGLARQYDERLRGAAGLKVVATRKAADGTAQDTVLQDFPAKNGQPLKLTLDTGVQNAADAALASIGALRGSVVAIRVSDGQILAVANTGNENLAFNAQVPPGSTFKAVTTLALLDAGKVTADQVVPCPKLFSIEGRQFKNSNSFELGNVPFHTDFARSCNTAFAALAPQLGPTGLATGAATVGLGQAWDLGTPVFTGKVSQNGNGPEQAAAAFGQGQTIVSPLSMAAVAAAVARGQWKQPVLILDPAPAKPAPDGQQLKPTTVDPLRAMMREVVTDGTAPELKSVTGGPVHGKTGTAEYDDNPDHTHAWFIGWQGDIAFAVFVEQGLHPADTALPVTRTFLNTLPR